MAVPNTTTFTLQDVKSEIESNGGSATTSLVAAFSNAIAAGFDSSYEGSKNQLLNFRNYNHIVGNVLVIGTDSAGGVSGFYIDNVSVASTVSVKFTYVAKFEGDLPITVKHSGNTVVMNVGDTFTTNLSISPGGNYDWFDFPFWVTSSSFGLNSTVIMKMEVLSSNFDTPPSPNNVTLIKSYDSL